jgi:hypothetical protein
MPVNANKLRSYDKKAVFQLKTDAQGQNEKVPAAKASALANLKEIGQNVVDAIDPTNNFRYAKGIGNESWMKGLDAILIPWAFALEIIDIAALPIKFAKDAVDAVYWSARAGAQFDIRRSASTAAVGLSKNLGRLA